MTEEMKFEIIKSLAYGLDVQTVAEFNVADIAEVNEIMLKYNNEIYNKKDEIKEVYGDVF